MPGRPGVSRGRALRAAVPRLSRFALEHLLLLPAGAAIALVWVNSAPESYYRFTYAIVVRRERRRDGLLLRADDQGGGGSDRARRCASSMAARVAAGGRLHRRDGRASADLRSGRRPCSTSRCSRSAWPVSLATDLAVSYFVARHDLPAASRDPVSPAARDRLRRPRLRGAGAVQSDTGPSSRRRRRSCWLSRWAWPAGCDGQESRASGRI